MRNLRIGPLELNAELLALRKGGRALGVGPKVAQTLLVLAERANEAVPKAELIACVWPDGFIGEGNLSQNIYVLRKLFRECGLPEAIETTAGGYRLTVPVEVLAHVSFAPRRLARSTTRVAASIAAAVVLIASISFVAASAFHHKDAQPAMSAAGQQAYDVGRYYLNLRTRDGVRKSLDYFAKALDSDPYDARPYAATADANVVMGDYCYGVHRPSVYFARARWYITRALALNPNSAEAHASAGFLAMHVRNDRAAQRELVASIALKPSYAPAHLWLALMSMRAHRNIEAAKELKTAAALDPLSTATLASLARVSYQQARYDDAVTFARMTLELQPRRADAFLTLGRAYAAQGRVAMANDAFARFRLADPLAATRNHPTWASLEYAAHQ